MEAKEPFLNQEEIEFAHKVQDSTFEEIYEDDDDIEIIEFRELFEEIFGEFNVFSNVLKNFDEENEKRFIMQRSFP